VCDLIASDNVSGAVASDGGVGLVFIAGAGGCADNVLGLASTEGVVSCNIGVIVSDDVSDTVVFVSGTVGIVVSGFEAIVSGDGVGLVFIGGVTVCVNGVFGLVLIGAVVVDGVGVG